MVMWGGPLDLFWKDDGHVGRNVLLISSGLCPKDDGHVGRNVLLISSGLCPKDDGHVGRNVLGCRADTLGSKHTKDSKERVFIMT